MSCCPPGSYPQLNTDYQCIGKEIELEGIKIYDVGTGSKCIIWNHDIFGWTAAGCGRTRQMCDLFAQKGYRVILPDFFHGKHCDPFKTEQAAIFKFINETSKWSILKPHIETAIAHAKLNGVDSFAAVGQCWGSYPVVKMSAENLIKCGISMHPSHGMLGQILGEKEEDMIKSITCPNLFFPCGNDPDSLKKGGLSEQILGQKLTIIEFPNRQHGFTSRGDFADSGMKEDLEKAITESIQFLGKHL